MNHQSLSAFIWSVADLLRGDYKQSDYGKVILPFTVLRRLDCVLEPTKAVVLAEDAKRKAEGLNPDAFLKRAAEQTFYNTSSMDMGRLIGDPDNVASNLYAYIQGFSAEVRDIFDRFEFTTQIDRLAKAGLLYQVTERFARVDLHPKAVDNHQMGLAFEELIRRFAELSNETAGEHFTPREVIRLMVALLFVEDDDVLSKPGVVRSISRSRRRAGLQRSAALQPRPTEGKTMYHQLATRFGRNAHQISRRDPLDNEALYRHVPSIFAREAHDSRSERYVYVPTIDIVEGLRREGWFPFFAVQSVPRDGSRHGHAKHMLRLRRDGGIGKAEAAEVIIVNSHDGTSAYQLVFGKQHDRLQLLDATYAAAHTKSMVRRNISDCDEKREAQLGRQAGGRLRAMIFSTTSSIPTAAITKPSSVVIEALLKTP